jgi:hypothetical protein
MYGVQSLEARGLPAAEQPAAAVAADVQEPHPGARVAIDEEYADPFGIDQVCMYCCTYVFFLVYLFISVNCNPFVPPTDCSDE